MVVFRLLHQSLGRQKRLCVLGVLAQSEWCEVTDEACNAGCHGGSNASWPCWAFSALAPGTASVGAGISTNVKEIQHLIWLKPLFSIRKKFTFFVRLQKISLKIWEMILSSYSAKFIDYSCSFLSLEGEEYCNYPFLIFVIHRVWQVEVKIYWFTVNPFKDLMLYSYRTWLMIFNRFLYHISKV